ncbi:putative oxidoreductase [Erwinia pyrifoliae DSM 12163]|nr:Short chain dehydrogenase, fragment [Erwinia pyrifoliae Ep1/96]CAY75557.1 putative oxidoreductase [Erwinia pyrifoliae DSM 12163]
MLWSPEPVAAQAGRPRYCWHVAAAIPMQRGGQPSEIAHAIAWLLSDDASHITGSIVDAAGGR